ncbi:MAG: hypothetical protein WCA22_19360 [Candidatus Binatus sp.]
MKNLPKWILTVAAGAVFAVGFQGVAGATRVWPAPELDPGTVASGLALLVGGSLIALERYRSR